MTSLIMQVNNVKNQKRFMRMELKKINLLALINRLDVEELRLKQNEYSWSITQVLEHLIIVERGVLLHFLKRPPKLSTYTLKLSNKFQFLLLRITLLGPFKLSIPKNVQAIQPKGISSVKELITEWADIRVQFAKLVQELPFNNKISAFPHPLSGYISAPQTLTFIADHIAHHTKQVIRIKKALNLND